VRPPPTRKTRRDERPIFSQAAGMTPSMTVWESPSFIELRMDAEIGSYQADEPGEMPAFARDADATHDE
jgi:hypothetical protein